MNKAKRLIRAKRKAKARRNKTYQPTKFKLGIAFKKKEVKTDDGQRTTG